MAIDTFAKIGDFEGESLDAKHKGEIEVQAWSWGVSQRSSISGGSGAAEGKPIFQELQFIHAVDKASPKLLKACATGEHIKEATITSRKAGAGQQEFLVIKMNDVIITSVQPSAAAGGLVENVSVQCAKVDFEYRPQKADGSLDAGIHFKYDIKANKVG